MKINHFLLPGLALGAAALLLAPPDVSLGYATLGYNLPAESQRDVRVYNNFNDAQSNNNTTIHANWPGWDGAELAIWKGCAEWGSEIFGDGTGDPLQTVGSGGANFDAHWAGSANQVGTPAHNIVSGISSCAFGVLAFTEGGGNGWRIRFCDGSWTWQDGPGNDGSQDIQGIQCHEYGHALGLDHSANSNSTMYAYSSGSGVSARSIEADDIAGVQYIYGVKSPTKPRITGVSVAGGTVTITGSNFSPTDNQVWFTNGLPTDSIEDPLLQVTGVSSTGGGTQIVVTPPYEAGPGDVLVKQNATGHGTLSNAYPLDIAGPDPGAMFSANPTTGTAPLLVTFTDESVGTGLSGWSWDFGDGATSTLRNPGHTYDNPGYYTVSLTVTGTLGSHTETKVNYIYADGGTTATATWRNGTGVNPDIFHNLTLPVLGTSWNTEIDGGAIGVGGLTFVVGYSAPFGGFVGSYGEILIDPTSSWAFTSVAFVGGGIASHSVSIPNDPALAGAFVYTQGYLNNVSPAGQLTNAWDLILGY